jgi:hypothetical protein
LSRRKALLILEDKLENRGEGGNRFRDVIKLIILLIVWMIAFLGMALSELNVESSGIGARAPKNDYEEEYYRKKREERNKNDVQRKQEMAE